MSAPTPPNSLLNTDAAHAFAARRLVEIAGDSILHFPESVSSMIFDILTRQVFSFESIQELAGQKFFEEMVCRLLPLASGLRGPA